MTEPFNRRFACIVGAPRTGTTSLSKYLRAHPGICFSNVKEPHYFSQWDLAGLADAELRQMVTQEYISRYFPHWPEGGSILMEGSVTYLYAPEKMRAILRLWPDVRFIVGLRDPMEMLPSLHQRLLFLGDETIEDFEQAWAMVDERRQGRRVPRSCIEPRWLRYDEVGRLGEYVERFTEIVGRDRCFFALHDDVKHDPGSVYRQAEQFLGLLPQDRSDFVPRRVSRGYKIGWLQRMLMRPPIITRKLMAGTHYRRRVETMEKLRGQDSRALRAVDRVRSRILQWNETAWEPVTLSPALRTEIRNKYLDDVARLGRIIDRDLSHWLADQAL